MSLRSLTKRAGSRSVSEKYGFTFWIRNSLLKRNLENNIQYVYKIIVEKYVAGNPNKKNARCLSRLSHSRPWKVENSVIVQTNLTWQRSCKIQYNCNDDLPVVNAEFVVNFWSAEGQALVLQPGVTHTLHRVPVKTKQIWLSVKVRHSAEGFLAFPNHGLIMLKDSLYAALWNRNWNRNFLTSGTGTVTC